MSLGGYIIGNWRNLSDMNSPFGWSQWISDVDNRGIVMTFWICQKRSSSLNNFNKQSERRSLYKHVIGKIMTKLK